jgi:hypothetical protein
MIEQRGHAFQRALVAAPDDRARQRRDDALRRRDLQPETLVLLAASFSRMYVPPAAGRRR